MNFEEVLIKTYPANGGPVKPLIGGDGFRMDPTPAGEYVIAYCKPHKSIRYSRWWSGIPWGTPLREHNGQVQVHMGRTWEPLDKHSEVSKKDIIETYKDLYGMKTFPATWVFNDFGHVTCYYYKDQNHNRKLDGKETICQEMIHSTPIDEALTTLNKEKDIILNESHGCIHVRPPDIDDMIRNGYLKKGNTLIVHPYNKFPPNEKTSTRGRAPYTVHFYPGAKVIMVIGRRI